MTERSARVAVAAVFFLYVLGIRTYDVVDTFLMLGEQTRDWTIALGGISELPLTGAPSTAGGRGFGPVYYWILWLGRHLIGPFTDNLPHAGGITVALVQSIADVWLLLVLWTRVGPSLALAMGLLIASAPFDIAISSVIWNPPVSAALIKMATAMALSLGATPPLWKIGATAALAWLAVQAHTSAIFVTAPLLLALVLQRASPQAPPQPRWAQQSTQPLWPQQPPPWRQTFRFVDLIKKTGLIAAVILLLQIPYFIAIAKDPSAPAGPTAALDTIANTQNFRIDRSFGVVVNSTGELLVRQMNNWQFQVPTLVAALTVLVAWRHDLVLLALSVGGIAGATILFSTWTRGYDSYWFLTLTTGMVLIYGMAIAAAPSRKAVQWIGIALLAGVALLQPMRISESTVFFKYPQYRPMRLASYALASQAPAVRDIRMTYDVHPTMDKYFMYQILGGRIDPSAPQRAFFNSDGTIRLE